MANLLVKNMVCPRCILVVEDILTELAIPHQEIEIGLVTLPTPLSVDKQKALKTRLNRVGLQLVQNPKDDLISKIKIDLSSLLKASEFNINISSYLCEKLNRNYSYLSRIFSESEQQTIQSYWLSLKIAKSKELLWDESKSISEISELLGYSTNSHFTVQFKKTTGVTPKQFRDSLSR